jgi:hypothetical protein
MIIIVLERVLRAAAPPGHQIHLLRRPLPPDADAEFCGDDC